MKHKLNVELDPGAQSMKRTSVYYPDVDAELFDKLMIINGIRRLEDAESKKM